ncbi:MAG: tyrosine-type recombinase/integrase [Planctomycetota bacterium]
MKPKKMRVPVAFLHKATNQDAVCLRDAADGRRRMVYLGVHGTAAAADRYREVIAEYLAGRSGSVRAPAPKLAGKCPTVGVLCAEYLAFAERFYRDHDGRKTGETVRASYAFDALLQSCRDIATDRIQIRHLLAVRQSMIDGRSGAEAKGRKAPNGLCRRTINDRMQTIKRLFRWGVEQGLVPGATWQELSALRGLPKGRSGVHDNAPVEAVPWPLVEATLQHLVPTVAALVLLQWWTGMRPAEALSMTRRQLEMTGETWLFKPSQHKGKWRDRERLIPLGPRAQEIVRPRLGLAMDAALFSAREAWEEFKKAKRAARKTKETKQQRARDARAAAAEPINEFLDTDGYRQHIERACDRAGVPRWSPHRLRHSAGTRLAEQLGIEAARAVLGHADVATTRRYAAGSDLTIAAGVARLHG